MHVERVRALRLDSKQTSQEGRKIVRYSWSFYDKFMKIYRNFYDKSTKPSIVDFDL